MALESGTYIHELNANNPVGATDQGATLDNHIRLVKSTVKNTFPNLTGAVNCTQAELNALDGIPGTLTSTEVGYLDGVTSGIQAQLDGKQATISLTASRAAVSDASGNLAASSVTSAELSYLSGVTSAIQTQLNAKQAAISLTASRVAVSDASGNLAASAITSAELDYLDGLTENVQTHIDSLGDAATKNVGTGANDVAAGNSHPETLIEEQVISSGTDYVTFSSIGDYETYRLDIVLATGSIANVWEVQFSESGVFQTGFSDYMYNYLSQNVNGNFVLARDASHDAIQLSASALTISGMVEFYGVRDAAETVCRLHTVDHDSGNDIATGGGKHLSSSAVDGVRICTNASDSAQVVSGTFRLYGRG